MNEKSSHPRPGSGGDAPPLPASAWPGPVQDPRTNPQQAIQSSGPKPQRIGHAASTLLIGVTCESHKRNHTLL